MHSERLFYSVVVMGASLVACQRTGEAQRPAADEPQAATAPTLTLTIPSVAPSAAVPAGADPQPRNEAESGTSEQPDPEAAVSPRPRDADTDSDEAPGDNPLLVGDGGRDAMLLIL